MFAVILGTIDNGNAHQRASGRAILAHIIALINANRDIQGS